MTTARSRAPTRRIACTNSPDARAGYAALSAKLDAVLRQWNTIRTSDVAALDAKLEAAGQKLLSLEDKSRH